MNRNYKYKDAEMLLASKIIGRNLADKLGVLSAIRTNWTTDYVNALTTKIDKAMDDFLALDKRQVLREATADLIAIQAPALRNISLLKAVIEIDFHKEAEGIMKKLGIASYFPQAIKGDQEALVQLLLTFRKGMTDKLREQMIAKGTSPEIIDTLLQYATDFQEANLSQESLKESSKQVSAEGVKIFNDIYAEVMGICKIGSRVFYNDPLNKSLFTFSKVVRNMNATRKIAQTSE